MSHNSKGEIGGADETSAPVQIEKRSQASVHLIDPGEGSGGLRSSSGSGSGGSSDKASKKGSSSSWSWTASKKKESLLRSENNLSSLEESLRVFHFLVEDFLRFLFEVELK